MVTARLPLVLRFVAFIIKSCDQISRSKRSVRFIRWLASCDHCFGKNKMLEMRRRPNTLDSCLIIHFFPTKPDAMHLQYSVLLTEKTHKHKPSQTVILRIRC
ncbi:uncharacterized protein F5Z01DRAFT_269070 [Emericellopsis atlantica]|uniref:Uncharacterized protein n=1 Tax=Emericellopsis atlantica TaxID=2614577 RepID=A0A9P7ZGT5_9HYPO|nr:uncharacterized protein F5Z01DRAFT_269070 [Emericellopsis atlantica]KAG9251542.1 hypothetical protein F5Z01DRAFT_269070 [Emericellopsis atlantica]